MNAHASILLNLVHSGACPRRESPSELLLSGTLAELVASGWPTDRAQKLIELRSTRRVEAELEAAQRLGVRIVTRGDREFPTALLDHPYCPPVIYVRGGEIPESPRIAIVGARNASRGMARFAAEIAEECAKAGIAVVSGLARGIDAAAHRGALTANGSCIGVLGCGVDIVYPTDATALFAAVRNRGCLMATWPLGTPPLPHHFPIRNRLLAALAQVVVVVQARLESGSMSTARAALDAGLDVLAVPGSPDDPLAAGTNSLIRDGARPVLEPRDAIEAILGVGSFRGRPRSSAPVALDPILTEIGSVARTADEIATALSLPIADVLERLVAGELRGEVERQPGGMFRLCIPAD